MKKFLKVIVIIAIIVVIIFAGAIAYFRLPVSEYYNNSEKAFKIPALDTAYVPQGFTYDENEKWFIATGYTSDGTCAPIYLIDKESGKQVKHAYLKNEDGSDYLGHGGGIAVWQNYIFLADASENFLLIFDYNDLKEVEDGGSIKSVDKFVTEFNGDKMRPDFVEVYGNRIVIGEFYKAEKYETSTAHHITTPNGDKNYALAVEFRLTDDFSFPIVSTPLKAYSMREQVQGVTFSENKIYLSTSWGLAFSGIFVYDVEKASEKTMTVFGADIPVIMLDSSSLVKEIKAPPMAEEMAIVDGKLYVLSESASKKYIFGKFTGGEWCYATDLSKYGLIG